MGGGDLNAKKAWHPNTLKNQERVWKAEQAAAEEKKRISELERERLQERERAELNKLAKSNLPQSGLTGNDRLHWMYEKPDKKVQQEEYLLGKAIDKNHEKAGKSAADEIPAVSRRVVGSSMLTVSGDTQVDLARKMREDPLLLVKERERAARAALLNNPVQRARLAELLRKEQKTMKESKIKKEKKKSKDLDNILAEKLQALSGKKGIDLASLLVSDDSSSESSDEKSKKKKKKNKKKSKSKNVSIHNSDLEEQVHKSKYDFNSKLEKIQKSNNLTEESDNFNIKRKKRQHSIDKQSSKSHTRKQHRDCSDNEQAIDNDLKEHKPSLNNSSKYESKKTISSGKLRKDITESDVNTKRKKRHHSIENKSDKLHDMQLHRDSSDEYQSSTDRLTKTKRSYAREERYWNNEQYINKYDKLQDIQYSRDERKQKDNKMDRDEQHKQNHGRHTDVGSYSKNKTLNDCRNEKSKGLIGQNVSSSDRSWRSNKRSGLSEEEKASKLADMVAAGAEREKQRERRVANQLAEKEINDRTSNSRARSRNVIHQLPDSLESRIHSNRHYIQRDQRHMNENFARR